MATAEFGRFLIVDGPSKSDMLASTFFGHEVTFVLSPEEHEGHRCTVKVRWLGARAESGSGYQWLVRFCGTRLVKGGEKPFPSVTGYYNSKDRTGWVKYDDDKVIAPREDSRPMTCMLREGDTVYMMHGRRVSTVAYASDAWAINAVAAEREEAMQRGCSLINVDGGVAWVDQD